ncbi:MAG: hypothetical protein SFU86_05150 [Pirellulaceae bacterium]|nr:hypothetical protein [Pirellulaceae bacterium]
MDARLGRAAIAVAALLALGANYRSENFIVTAPTAQLAAEVCTAAENFRRDLAIEWLGQELPPWHQPCPIDARQITPQLGAGGETSFMFDAGVPFGWRMRVQGSRERVLDSVLPHEVTHTIFATHFGRPLPRWADEGACTTVEHQVERSKQDRFLIEFLTTERGIPFNQMFAMREYPRDIMPLYSQGYSLAKFLIQQGGKRKFVDYVGAGMQRRNWTSATKEYYGYSSLSELQTTWVEWVRQGSPKLAEPNLVAAQDMRGQTVAAAAASATTPANGASLPPEERAGWQTVAAQNERVNDSVQSFVRPPAPTNFATPAPAAIANPNLGASVSRPISEGWYAKRRDQAQQVRQAVPATAENPIPTGLNPAPPTDPAPSPAPTPPPGNPMPVQPIPAPPTRTPIPSQRRVLMEWSRDKSPAPTELAIHNDGTIAR